MMNIGFVLPEDGYLAGLVETAHRHGAVAIFDEVKTGVTIAPGGATERFGVVPDIVCLAKAIGGGLPCGAVGGRADIMATISDGKRRAAGHVQRQPADHRRVARHAARGAHRPAYSHLDALTEELSGGLRDVMSRVRPALPRGLDGSPRLRHLPQGTGAQLPRLRGDGQVAAYVSWLYQTNRGVLMAPGAEENWTLSVQHSSDDVRRYVDNFKEFARDITSA